MKIFNFIMILGAALLLWFGASFIDIIEDNNTTAQHSEYNLFCLINDIEG